MTLKILTANSLLSGGVVYLTSQNNWSPFISQAQVSDDVDTIKRLEAIGLRAEAEQIVVGPFLIAVTIENGIPRPTRFRERLRVNGPSVRSEFSKPLIKEVA
jgi:hypothetical protein